MQLTKQKLMTCFGGFSLKIFSFIKDCSFMYMHARMHSRVNIIYVYLPSHSSTKYFEEKNAIRKISLSHYHFVVLTGFPGCMKSTQPRHSKVQHNPLYKQYKRFEYFFDKRFEYFFHMD